MEYSRHIDRSLNLAVQLVNALTPGQECGTELAMVSGSEARLAAALAALPVNDEYRAVAALDDRDTEQLYELAARLRPIFEAGSVDSAAVQAAHLLAHYHAAPELVQGNDGLWRLHFHSASASIAYARGSGCATALAMLIDAGQLSRIGVCEAHNCDRVFFDASRNGCKRYCSSGCMSRAKTAHFRQRHYEVEGKRRAGVATPSRSA